MKHSIAFAICLSAASLVAGPAAAACVENGTDESLFFTIESRADAARTSATLAPGDRLCLRDTTSAIFTAFATHTSVEGCPRLSGPDGQDRLVQFVPTDSCRWGSHGE